MFLVIPSWHCLNGDEFDRFLNSKVTFNLKRLLTNLKTSKGLIIELAQVTEYMYTGPAFKTPVLSHDLFGHCNFGVTELICRANNLPDRNQEWPDCSIPVSQRVKMVHEDLTWSVRYPFMEILGICLLRSRGKELSGHVQVVLVEYVTSCLFHKVVPGERVNVEVVRLLSWLPEMTGKNPRELVFTGQQGIRLHKESDLLRVYLEGRGIEFTPMPPLVLVPYRGHAKLFDALDGQYRAICPQHGVRWVDSNSY